MLRVWAPDDGARPRGRVPRAHPARPRGSIVSYTGLTWLPAAIAARERGVLVRRPMFTAIEPDGVREADGSLTPVDVILWATGFQASLDHLAPLGLRNALGGITVRGRGGTVADWLLGRSGRVFTPLGLLLVLMAVSAFAARQLGVSDYDIAQAVSVVVLPLWFLVVYLAPDVTTDVHVRDGA